MVEMEWAQDIQTAKCKTVSVAVRQSLFFPNCDGGGSQNSIVRISTLSPTHYLFIAYFI